MALTHLPLYVGTAEPLSNPGDRSHATSAGGDLSPEEVVAAYHERTKHHFHRYAARDGIRQFSEWPMIPQLYVGGEFIEGCDSVREMNASEARLSSARRRRQLHSQYANPAAVATASSQTTCFMQKV